MNKAFLFAVLLTLMAGVAIYLDMQQEQVQPAPVAAPVPVPPAVEQAQEVVESPPVAVELPPLSDSDEVVLEALSGLINNTKLMNLLRAEGVIRYIVATIDNLPRNRAPMRVMPLKSVQGTFLTTGAGDTLAISPQNAARYGPYMKLVASVSPSKTVETYIKFYPLFQQAYEELGYPGKYFNDRLVVVIDDLLAAPDIVEPVQLTQPKVLYEFADPELESRSIGQRILMRIGSANEAKVKTWLTQVRQQLKLHMHERKPE